jgi:hypothetical protein
MCSQVRGKEEHRLTCVVRFTENILMKTDFWQSDFIASFHQQKWNFSFYQRNKEFIELSIYYNQYDQISKNLASKN